MWTLLAREHHSVKPDAHGNKPLDAAISQMQHNPRIIVHRMPQPIGRQPAPDADPKLKPPKPPKVRPGKRGRNAPNVPEELKDCHHAADYKWQTDLLGIQFGEWLQIERWWQTTFVQSWSSRLCILQKGGTQLPAMQECKGRRDGRKSPKELT